MKLTLGQYLLMISVTLAFIRCNCKPLLDREIDSTNGFSKRTESCSISLSGPGTVVVSRHAGRCAEMDASLYSYSVQQAEGPDSMQSTEFSDAGPNGLTGSFEFDHSLTPTDSLLIVLGEELDLAGASEHGCRRLTVCNQSADGRRRRLRLRISLRPDWSYTMKIFKLANGSGLCEAPQLRFFFTRPAGAALPLVQLAARRCGGCSLSDSADFNCSFDAYLRTGWPEGLQLKVTGVNGGTSDRLHFGRRSSLQAKLWTRVNFSMPISSNLQSLTLHFRRETSRYEEIQARRSFVGLGKNRLLRPTLCHSEEPLAVCSTSSVAAEFASLLATDAEAASAADASGRTPVDLLLSCALPPALCLLACVALYQALKLRHSWHQWKHQRCVVTLVLPGSDSGVSSNRAPIRQLILQLAVAPGVKTHRIVGLKRLTRSLTVSSHLVVFVSRDSGFASFRVDSEGLSNEASQSLRTLLLTEKHKVRGFYIDSLDCGEASPLESSSLWSGVRAERLGQDDAGVRKSVSSLLDLMRDHCTVHC